MQTGFTTPHKQSFLFSDNSSAQFIIHHKPFVVWLTGLSGSGKTTLGSQLHSTLKSAGLAIALLDGDIIRQGLCSDLGYTQEDRDENIRRVAEVSKLMLSVGVVVVVAFISPTIKEREMAKNIIGNEHFIEVHVNASLKTCINRDPKGLYKKALLGEIKAFTGIDAPYEVPVSPNIKIDTEAITVEAATAEIWQFLEKNKFIELYH